MAMIQLAESVMISSVGDEYVLLDSLNGHYYSLDPVGRQMIDLALECDSEQAVLQELISRYDASIQLLTRDFSNLVTELMEIGLITMAAPNLKQATKIL